ncbi:unnamed protein product [Porites evermanni]|uniref:Uncharacterized protein n=1 Tax=Porites evermanni TaxID=104178 RepID=A0ABN8LQW0_9CNID|nr:unnamed protein product [Porites evermanni]
MVEQALRAFAQQNFGADGEEFFYPVHQGNTEKVQILALMAKKPRNVFLRPFKTNSLVFLGGLDTYMNRSKKEEYQNAVEREIKRDYVEVTLELDEDNENDEGDDAATGRKVEAEVQVGACANAKVKVNKEIGNLEMGKIHKVYVQEPGLRDILKLIELDSDKVKDIRGHKLRLITSVVYSERLKLRGKRFTEFEVDGGVIFPNSFLARLTGRLKTKCISPKLATRKTHGPVLFKCCKVVLNEMANKLQLAVGELVGVGIRRSDDDDDAEEYENTAVHLDEDEQSDLEDSFSEESGDEKNLETIKNSVLIPTKNRGERKLRINKYLNWLEKALTERETKISVDEPLDEADCSFLRSVYVTAYPKDRTVYLHGIEIEKIQGYAIVFKLLAGLSDNDWEEVEKAWAESNVDNLLQESGQEHCQAES